MPRPPRREAESGIHHVMNRGVDRQPVFLSDDDRLDFGHQLTWVHEHLGVKLLAYCLMGNHYHLLLRVDEGVLSDAMQHVGSVFTRHLNDRHGRDGPVFRGRFTSIPVEDDAYLLTVVRYIHRNPVGLPGVVRPADYRWSSYRAYLGLRPKPAFLDTSLVMSMLGGRLDRLVAVTEDRSTSSIDGLGPRLLPGRPVTMTEVRSVVRSAIAMADIDQELSREASWRALGATVELLLVDRLDLELGRLVAANQPRRSRDATRMARLRAEKRLEADPIVARTLVAVLAYFARTPGVRHQPFAGTFGA